MNSQTPTRLRGSRPGRRLVEEQHARSADQARRDVQTPAHPTRVRLRGPAGCLGQIEALQGLGRALAGFRLVEPVQATDHLDVLEPGEVLVDRRALAGETDPVAKLLGVGDHVEAVHLGATAARQQQRRQDPNRGGLAGAVGTEQAEHHPGLDIQVDAFQSFDVTEPAFEPLGTDDRLGHGRAA